MRVRRWLVGGQNLRWPAQPLAGCAWMTGRRCCMFSEDVGGIPDALLFGALPVGANSAPAEMAASSMSQEERSPTPQPAMSYRAVATAADHYLESLANAPSCLPLQMAAMAAVPTPDDARQLSYAKRLDTRAAAAITCGILEAIVLRASSSTSWTHSQIISTVSLCQSETQACNQSVPRSTRDHEHLLLTAASSVVLCSLACSQHPGDFAIERSLHECTTGALVHIGTAVRLLQKKHVDSDGNSRMDAEDEDHSSSLPPFSSLNTDPVSTRTLASLAACAWIATLHAAAAHPQCLANLLIAEGDGHRVATVLRHSSMFRRLVDYLLSNRLTRFLGSGLMEAESLMKTSCLRSSPLPSPSYWDRRLSNAVRRVHAWTERCARRHAGDAENLADEDLVADHRIHLIQAASDFSVALNGSLCAWVTVLRRFPDLESGEQDATRESVLALTTCWMHAVRSNLRLASFAVSRDVLESTQGCVPLYQAHILDIRRSDTEKTKKSSRGLLKLLLLLAMQRPLERGGCYEQLDALIAQIAANGDLPCDRRDLLRAAQERFGDWWRSEQPTQPMVTPPSEGSSIPALAASWINALRAISLELKGDSSVPEERHQQDWRDRLLPRAIRLCAEAGRAKTALRLFDEYAAVVDASTVSGGWYQRNALSTEAAYGLSVVARDTGRWYRAMDVMTVLSQCRPSSDPKHRAMVNRTIQNAAAMLKGRWSESLSLLHMLEPMRGTRAASDDSTTHQVVQLHALQSVVNRLVLRGMRCDSTSWDWAAALTKCGAEDWVPYLQATLETHVSESRRSRAEHVVRRVLVLAASATENLRRMEELRLALIAEPVEVVDYLTEQLTLQQQSSHRFAEVLEVVFHDLGQGGCVRASLRLCRRLSCIDSMRVRAWETCATALQHAYRSLVDNRQSISELQDLFNQLVSECPSDILLNHRIVLQRLLRSASENFGGPCLEVLQRRLDSVLSALPSTAQSPIALEYHNAAVLLLGASITGLRPHHHTTAGARHRRLDSSVPVAIFSEPQLLHAVVTSAAAASALSAEWGRSSHKLSRRKDRRPGTYCVAFCWTNRELKILQTQHNGDLGDFVTRRLNVPMHHVHSKDRSGGSPTAAGSLVRMFPVSTPSAIVDAGDDSLVTTSCISQRWNNQQDDFAVALKPAGVTMDAFLRSMIIRRAADGNIAATPLYQIQTACSGLLVVVPEAKSPKRGFHLRYVLLLGLRRIVSVSEATPLPAASFFVKYHMSVLALHEQGSLLPSSEVVVVEAICESDAGASTGAAGTLYELSMDLASEGWGYAGDAGNRFAEKHMAHESRDVSQDSSEMRSVEDRESLLDHRAWFFVREVTVTSPLVSDAHHAEDVEGGEDDGVRRGRVVQVELPVPHWWVHDGLLPREFID